MHSTRVKHRVNPSGNRPNTTVSHGAPVLVQGNTGHGKSEPAVIAVFRMLMCLVIKLVGKSLLGSSPHDIITYKVKSQNAGIR